MQGRWRLGEEMRQLEHIPLGKLSYSPLTQCQKTHIHWNSTTLLLVMQYCG